VTDPGIAVVVNPRSRANLRNPRLAGDFQSLMGAHGRVLAPKTLAELDEVAAAMRRSPPAVVAVHGGDGTLHRVVTALGAAFGDEPIPPIAILCGGTMNVVATSLRLRERPATFLASLVESVRGGQPMETLRRRCLRIGDELGFLFGNGLLANFLGEYYGTGAYGPGRAAWLIVRGLFSSIVGGPFMRRLFRRFEGTVRVDGVELERSAFVGLAAGTVREVGLGFKLVHRADDDPERFGVLAIHGAPLTLIPDLWSVHAGHGVAPTRAFSGVASSMEIVPRRGPMGYTIDGDLYRGDGALRIGIGPALRLVKPAAALIVRGRSDTMSADR
jgi:diacylglycerol kinase (ATP)